MRVLMVLFALVATPFLASVSQEQGGSDQRELTGNHGVRHAYGKTGQRGRGHDAEQCAARAAKSQHDQDRDQDRGRDDQKCAPVDPPPPPPPPPPPSSCAQAPAPTGTGTVQGQVFQDASPFPGLASWCVDLSGPVTAVAITDASGNYTFSGLPPGAYTVCEEVQTGWHVTFPPAPQGGATCPNGFGYGFTLTAGGGAMFIDFGNVTP